MKKILAFLLAAVMVLSFTACGKTKEAAEYTRGTWEGDVYKNDFMKFTFTLPEGFVVSTDEELMAMLENGQKYLTGDIKKSVELAMESESSFYDLALTNPTTRSSMMFMVENLSKTPGANSLSEKDYLDILGEQLVTVESLGYKIVERSEELVAEQAYQVLEVSAADGLLTQKYYVKKVGNYMVAFIGTYDSANADAFNAFVSSITKI